MLEESQDLYNNLKKTAQLTQLKKERRKALLKKYKKRFIIMMSIFIIGSSLFFPKETGSIIGKWISDFFGTIVKESNK